MEMPENRLNILVVLYKRGIYESETLLSILKCKNELRPIDTLIIWNNSPTNLSTNEKDTLKNEMMPVCVSFEGNNGVNYTLPYIYTYVYRRSNNSDVLVIFDHDSLIPTNYFSELLEAISDNKSINLFLPIIYSGKFIVSPSFSFIVKGAYWKKKRSGILKAKYITAINSGMAIRCHYLINFFEGYNMNLKFYETDNDFMDKYSSNNLSLYVLKSCMNHTLDFYDNSNIENKLERFSAMRYGRLNRMKDKNSLSYFLSYIQYLYFGFKCAFIYKEYRFIYLAISVQ